MDIKPLYDKYHNYAISCNIKDKFKINKYMIGSGGSENIIIELFDKDGTSLIFKIIPDMVMINVKVKPDVALLEIKFYQFFTKKYILTDRTPHIVAIYNHQQCPNLRKTLQNIKPGKKNCQPYKKLLLTPIQSQSSEKKICDLILKYDNGLVNPVFDMLLLENCPLSFSDLLEYYMFMIHNSSGKTQKININKFLLELDRSLFQLIFTLAIIKDDYPGFYHGDFFARNILGVIEKNYNSNDYVAYHYKQKIFYLKANGPYLKINDFGLTVIANELEPNVFGLTEKIRKFFNINPFNKKTEIFNILHDIYDGQNFGTKSIIRLAEEYKLTKNKIKPIRNYLKKFINVDMIDKINTINPGLLGEIWHIDDINVLENTVKTPRQYLMGKYFAELQNLPKNATIVKHYN